MVLSVWLDSGISVTDGNICGVGFEVEEDSKDGLVVVVVGRVVEKDVGVVVVVSSELVVNIKLVTGSMITGSTTYGFIA